MFLIFPVHAALIPEIANFSLEKQMRGKDSDFLEDKRINAGFLASLIDSNATSMTKTKFLCS